MPPTVAARPSVNRRSYRGGRSGSNVQRRAGMSDLRFLLTGAAENQRSSISRTPTPPATETSTTATSSGQTPATPGRRDPHRAERSWARIQAARRSDSTARSWCSLTRPRHNGQPAPRPPILRRRARNRQGARSVRVAPGAMAPGSACRGRLCGRSTLVGGRLCQDVSGAPGSGEAVQPGPDLPLPRRVEQRRLGGVSRLYSRQGCRPPLPAPPAAPGPC